MFRGVSCLCHTLFFPRICCSTAEVLSFPHQICFKFNDSSYPTDRLEGVSHPMLAFPLSRKSNQQMWYWPLCKKHARYTQWVNTSLVLDVGAAGAARQGGQLRRPSSLTCWAFNLVHTDLRCKNQHVIGLSRFIGGFLCMYSKQAGSGLTKKGRQGRDMLDMF